MVVDVRPSPIAGSWYSADPEVLAREVDGYLSCDQPYELDGEVVGVVVPHAGHRYSGKVAGCAFEAVRGLKRDLVAVISPLHDYHPAALLTTAHKGYATPLGVVPVDVEAVNRLDQGLRKEGNLNLTPVAYDEEHSLEIELPFLQRSLAGEFKLLPVMVRSQSPLVAKELGTALAEVMSGRNGLLVASSDLSHYNPLPVANEMDGAMLKAVASLDPGAVWQTQRSGKGYACGVAAIATVLEAARQMGVDEVRIVRYDTSADTTGDEESVVGYGAALILRHS
jgi:AmmeMemoRadiSam system protein B